MDCQRIFSNIVKINFNVNLLFKRLYLKHNYYYYYQIVTCNDDHYNSYSSINTFLSSKCLKLMTYNKKINKIHVNMNAKNFVLFFLLAFDVLIQKVKLKNRVKSN